MKSSVQRISGKMVKIYGKSGYADGSMIVLGKIFYRFIALNIIKLLKKMIKTSSESRIVIESRPDFGDNGRSIYEYMIEHKYNRKYKIVWLVEEPKQFASFKKRNVKFVRKFGRYHRKRTVRAFYHVLKSKYIMFTHACRWAGTKTSNQVYINLWHGCGYKGVRGEEGGTNEFDYCLVPGTLFIKTKSEFFSCDENKILPIGYPRYDEMRRNNKNADRLLKSYNDKSNKNILWMPTFRDSEQLLYYKDPISSIIGIPLMKTVLDFGRVDEMCRKNNVNLIIKWHRNVLGCSAQKNAFTNLFFLDNTTLDEQDIKLYELLPKTDALITDYSSAAIDYLLLNKPIGFTLDDYEDYERTRGFVFEDAKAYMPGKHMYQLDDLEAFIKEIAADQDDFAKAREKMLPEAHNITDNYCHRILEHFGITI